jgi:hypothetical protein
MKAAMIFAAPKPSMIDLRILLNAEEFDFEVNEQAGSQTGQK